jgi:hypothetical protein
MKTFNERMMQMRALLESWQTGKPFNLIDTSLHSIPSNVSAKIDKLFSESVDTASPDRDNSEVAPKTRNTYMQQPLARLRACLYDPTYQEFNGA